MTAIVFDIPSFMGITKKELTMRLGEPSVVDRIDYFTYEDWDDIPVQFLFYLEDVDQVMYQGIPKSDIAPIQNGIVFFEIGVRSKIVKGILLQFPDNKINTQDFYPENKILDLFGLGDIGEPNRRNARFSSWWNFRRWTVQLRLFKSLWEISVGPSQVLFEQDPLIRLSIALRKVQKKWKSKK